MSELPAVTLRLYTNGDDALTEANTVRLKALLGMPATIEVIDVIRDPAAAERDRVLITPTLMRLQPPPQLRVSGDLSDLEAALDGLGIRTWTQNGRPR